ncbi:hypothetical protein M406DRAFT_330424 [Cryphonectria parasitica EP155]|uniref:Uncharacterized protein n=1 Tax=Cryphonectria parasitica (strain ATCC 38755 / EP155) TaxID=660469 RepID=A0A9P4XZV2_CRYP1|nr:uncharacterized protein M406DRAFT_330424 [Cryphonectria parasitica EP155]KAF3764068.1 hypothetical protein M406DRAFT_330424 [Cryphonectria parasitica EP155]
MDASVVIRLPAFDLLGFSLGLAFTKGSSLGNPPEPRALLGAQVISYERSPDLGFHCRLGYNTTLRFLTAAEGPRFSFISRPQGVDDPDKTSLTQPLSASALHSQFVAFSALQGDWVPTEYPTTLKLAIACVSVHFVLDLRQLRASKACQPAAPSSSGTGLHVLPANKISQNDRRQINNKQ